MSDPTDAKDFAKRQILSAGLDWPTYEKQIQTESGWRHWSSPGVVLRSPTGSMGLGQLNSHFYPESDWRDPYANLSKSVAIMADYVKRFGSYRKALAAYNWGPGNVGGYTKSDGVVVPPWDGRRETISAQGARYLDAILGPGWSEPTEVLVPSSAIVYEDFRDPQPAGRFASMPKGIILHGSRSGKAGNPKATEYLGTARYEVANTDDLGWNATIGENRVAVHLTPQEWGWNARAASDDYLAVEFAQATVDESITDAQVAAFCDWVTTRVLPTWGATFPLVFPTHAELDGTAEYGGYHDGKTDVYPKGVAAADDLRARIMAALGQAPAPQPVYSVGPGILQAMTDRGDQPACDELFFKQGERDEWSEAFGTSGRRYIWLPSVARIFVYDPAA